MTCALWPTRLGTKNMMVQTGVICHLGIYIALQPVQNAALSAVACNAARSARRGTEGHVSIPLALGSLLLHFGLPQKYVSG